MTCLVVPTSFHFNYILISIILCIPDVCRMSSVLTSVTLDVAVCYKPGNTVILAILQCNNLKPTIQTLVSEWVPAKWFLVTLLLT